MPSSTTSPSATDMSFASGMEQAWYRGASWLWLLRPLEIPFRSIAATRRWLYASGRCDSYRAPVPVVVVGNITVGGTGKTPVVIALVEALQAAGLRPGVISRGYGASVGGFPRELSANSRASEVGDEPLLIYQRTGAPCVVDPQRARAAQSLLARHPVDILISDDGLQHYALARDFEIALLDQQRGIGNGFCLPAGPLREPPSRLDSVDCLLYRGGEGEHDSVRYQPTALVDVVSGKSLPFDKQQFGASVLAVTGIGQPEQFFASLRAAGFKAQEQVFPDHYAYTKVDIEAFGDGPVIITEKDAVKCRTLLTPRDVGRLWYLRIDAVLPAVLIERVTALVKPA
ncbi:MAG: tetraacyldisaccharide 4'-kinase [Parahaliea sp.]